MPSVIKRTTLRLLSSLPTPKGSAHPVERDINRQILMNSAPDREALFMGDKSLEEIRRTLKIEAGPPEGTRRNSQRIVPAMSSRCKKDEILAGRNSFISVQTSAQSADPMVPSNASNPASGVAQTWPRRALSTGHQLISPRPLGATHTLIIYDKFQSDKKRVYIECPINGLIFTLHCPNVVNPSALVCHPSSHLPRVVLRAPHARSFVDLVAYFHTRDQVALFKKVLPEWVRDLLHPLPVAAQIVSASPSEAMPFVLRSKRSQVFGLGKRKRSRFSGLSSANDTKWTPSPRASSSTSLPFSTACRTVQSIAREIADIDTNATWDAAVPDLVQSVVRLNALKDNLEEIGLYSPGLWQEVDVTWEILIRAVNLQAQVVGQ